MLTMFKPYLDVILSERSWSWSLIGILYVLAGLFVRSWFLGPVMGKAKKLDKSVFKAVKSSYFKRSLLGWLFFFLPLAAFTLYWQKILPPVVTDKMVAGGVVSLLVLSIMFHLQAFGAGVTAVLKKQTENMKEKSLFEA